LHIKTLLLLAAAAGAHAQTLVVTSSNATANQLLVYNANAQLVQTISTQGAGGVSGNAGRIAVMQNHLAVVNFGSASVSLFQQAGNGFQGPRLAALFPQSSHRSLLSGGKAREF
jgi:hypothetical protein